MVKRALLILSLLTVSSYGATYQINVVKEEPSASVEKRYVIYRVKRGDTLLKIMKKFKVPRRFLYRIAQINRLKNPNLIYPGQEIKLPVGKKEKVERRILKGRRSGIERELHLIKLLGGRVNREGYLFVGNRKISLRRNPIVKVGEEQFLLDFSGLSSSVKQKLAEVGISVVSGENLGPVLEKVISANFSSLQKNGELIVGENDVLTYHYDYLAYNRYTGQRTVINTSPDTPPTLKSLLAAYGIAVVEPPFKVPDDWEGWGRLKILTGGGLQKIEELIKLFTGSRGKKIPEGLVFPKLKLAVVYDYITPERRTELELQGNRVFVLTGNFLSDVESILSLIPMANKFVKLVLYEPPGTKGKRSKFVIEGLLVSTPKRDWFMVDSVDKPEEIPYLRYRGVNLIIY